MKVNQIKKKVAAKVAKGKTKVAKKCGRAGKRTVAAGCVLAILALVAGCLRPTTPSRSQSLVMRDCTVNIYGGGAETGDVARVEIASQAMSVETSGTETQTVTPTQTTDTKPEIAVGVGGSSAGVGASGGASKQGVGAAVGGAVDALVGARPAKAEASQLSQPSQQSQPSQPSCPNGECSPGEACKDCAPAER